jgi:hypothetical protein
MVIYRQKLKKGAPVRREERALAEPALPEGVSPRVQKIMIAAIFPAAIMRGIPSK